MQAGNRFRPNAPDQHQGKEYEEGIQHLRAQYLHQNPCRQRADTCTHTVGHQQHRRQRYPALAFHVVIGKGNRQRVQAELQQRDQEADTEQQLQRHTGQYRQWRSSQCQPHRHATNQHSPVITVRQPAQRPLHQQAGKNAATHEQTDLLGTHPLA